MYDILNKCTTTPTGQKIWCEILDQPDLDWKKVYNLPFKVTKNTKLQWLQNRINHHILVTNYFLLKVKIIDNPDCTFCHQIRNCPTSYVELQFCKDFNRRCQ